MHHRRLSYYAARRASSARLLTPAAAPRYSASMPRIRLPRRPPTRTHQLPDALRWDAPSEAELRIATGLVEPHFMAGYSGGRKVIAPGVAHEDTIRTFHSARFMEDPAAIQCNLAGNPLHEEQLEIVRMLGDVYAVNTVIDEDRDLVHVNFGEVIESHLEAVAFVAESTRVPFATSSPRARATAAMIADHTLLGCGPGNFQEHYARYKLPQASETVGDPHNFLLEIWATAGTPRSCRGAGRPGSHPSIAVSPPARRSRASCRLRTSRRRRAAPLCAAATHRPARQR